VVKSTKNHFAMATGKIGLLVGSRNGALPGELLFRPNVPHIGLVGDTYTILLSGKDTAGRYCVIDMYVPPGGGPPPHRHDFEETFVLLDGELQATFRGEKRIVRSGQTIHVPANAPHQFHNSSSKPVRMLCICSPSGQEKFFKEVGTPVSTRTTPPPTLSEAQQASLKKRVMELAPKYRTELLTEA
jgi:quercetin dioxygenase-like cupin family protein